MKKCLSTCLVCFLFSQLSAQHYDDYLGAGHNNGITVSTSNNSDDNHTGAKSVDGFPITNEALLSDASRFLSQATIGYNYSDIEMVAAMGYEKWINEQFKMPHKNITNIAASLDQQIGDGEGMGFTGFQMAWQTAVLKDNDMLRQKMTYALSQIFVVSAFGSDLFEDFGDFSSVYYDMLNKNAFGNYRDLLVDVSLSPTMGVYLSHLNNPKTDPVNNIHPDENYAREIMQLFSIGLYELNNDGTRKLDSLGNFIPTYDNDDIKEFAKVFTGFMSGHPDAIFGHEPIEDSEGDFLILEFPHHPMVMNDNQHELGQKFLLNGIVVPDGQTGMEDFNMAIDNLFNHPNTGPFIGKAFIKLLVTSNPSPAYVNRVANAFNDNGQGVRGDLQAVIKAILLDPEARNCTPQNNDAGGKLREPLMRYTGLLKAFEFGVTKGEFDYIITDSYDWYENTGQIAMFAPSVFNFYSPDYQPQGLISLMDYYAPVFQIHNASTSIGYANQIYGLSFEPDFLYIEEDDELKIPNLEYGFDFSTELALVADKDFNGLVTRLDILLACGQLSDRTKNIITNALQQIAQGDEEIETRELFGVALYLVLISPEYAFLK